MSSNYSDDGDYTSAVPDREEPATPIIPKTTRKLEAPLDFNRTTIAMQHVQSNVQEAASQGVGKKKLRRQRVPKLIMNIHYT